MAKLIGKSAGDEIVEFYGPITGRNYNTVGLATPVAPRVVVQVFGTGSVQVQETQDYVLKGNPGLNTFTRDRLPDEDSWAGLGAVIDQSSGQVTLNPTADDEFTAIRVIVVTPGDGKVVVQNDWV